MASFKVCDGPRRGRILLFSDQGFGLRRWLGALSKALHRSIHASMIMGRHRTRCKNARRSCASASALSPHTCIEGSLLNHWPIRSRTIFSGWWSSCVPSAATKQPHEALCQIPVNAHNSHKRTLVGSHDCPHTPKVIQKPQCQIVFDPGQDLQHGQLVTSCAWFARWTWTQPLRATAWSDFAETPVRNGKSADPPHTIIGQKK